LTLPSSTQVLLKDAVLLPQVVDDIVLMPIHPARERHKENPQPHGVDHGPSLFGWSSAPPAVVLG